MIAPILFAALLLQESTASATPSLVHTPPTGCLAYVELRRPGTTLRELVDHEVLGPLLAQLGETVLAGSGELGELLASLDERIEAPALDVVDGLAGRGIAAWVTVGQPANVTISFESADAETGSKWTRTLLAALADASGHAGALDAPTELVGESELWQIGEDLTVARTGSHTYVSNARVAIDAVVAPKRAVRGRRALERLLDVYARRARGQEVFVWADLGTITSFIGMAGDIGPMGEALTTLVELPRKPPVQSLLGPGIAYFATASSLVVTLDVASDRADLQVIGDGLVGTPAPWATAMPPSARIGSTGNCASALLYRDFATILGHRDELFDAPSLAGIASTISQFELFLGGLTLEDDVLPHLSPWVELVSRVVPFERAPEPAMRLPSLALVVRIEDAPRLGEHLDAAFQGLVSVVNIERSQNGEPPFRLVLGREGERTWTGAHLPKPGPDEAVDAIYNLAPACAVVGDRWIVATHEELLLDIADELDAALVGTAFANPTESLTIRGGALADLARPQLDALVLAHSLNEGKTREVARQDMEGLIWILERTDVHANIEYEASSVALRAGLRFPGASKDE